MLNKSKIQNSKSELYVAFYHNIKKTASLSFRTNLKSLDVFCITTDPRFRIRHMGASKLSSFESEVPMVIGPDNDGKQRSNP